MRCRFYAWPHAAAPAAHNMEYSSVMALSWQTRTARYCCCCCTAAAACGAMQDCKWSSLTSQIRQKPGEVRYPVGDSCLLSGPAHCLNPSHVQEGLKDGEKEEDVDPYLPLSTACKSCKLSALDSAPCALLLTVLVFCLRPCMYCMLPSVNALFWLPPFRLWQESDGRSIGCNGACVLR